MQHLARLTQQLRPRSSIRQLSSTMTTALIPIVRSTRARSLHHSKVLITGKLLILFIQADGTEEIEAITLADVLTRGGVQVTLATISSKPQNIVTMSRGVKVQGDVAIEECAGKSFDLVVCPGVRFEIAFFSFCFNYYFIYSTF